LFGGGRCSAFTLDDAGLQGNAPPKLLYEPLQHQVSTPSAAAAEENFLVNGHFANTFTGLRLIWA
jgi:hypothetical protein